MSGGDSNSEYYDDQMSSSMEDLTLGASRVPGAQRTPVSGNDGQVAGGGPATSSSTSMTTGDPADPTKPLGLLVPGGLAGANGGSMGLGPAAPTGQGYGGIPPPYTLPPKVDTTHRPRREQHLSGAAVRKLNREKRLLAEKPEQRGEKRSRSPKQADGNPAKRVSGAKSFKEAASKALDAAVVFVGDHNRLIGQEDAESIRESITSQMLDADEGIPLHFSQSGIIAGTFRILAEDELSLNWLKEIVPKIDFKGCKLEVILFKDLKLVKVGIRIPLPTGKERQPDYVVKLIKRQNAGLNTDNWILQSNRIEEEKNQIMIFRADSQSVEVLKQLNNKVHFELRQVPCWIETQYASAAASGQPPAGGSA